MDENPAAVALDNARVCERILSYISAERAEQIRRALAAGLHEDQLAAALGVGLDAVRDSLRLPQRIEAE